MTTYRMVKIECENCGCEMINQGGNVFCCPNCGKFFRLKEVKFVFKQISPEEGQEAFLITKSDEALLESLEAYLVKLHQLEEQGKDMRREIERAWKAIEKILNRRENNEG